MPRGLHSIRRGEPHLEAFIGVVIGGLVSIVTTVVVDHVRARRELKHRWDAAGLDAVAEFIDLVNKAIGALYDEGVSRHRDPNGERTAQLDRVSRAAMDAVRVSHAKARLVMNSLSDRFADYYSSLHDLKAIADAGFPSADSNWKQAQDNLRQRLDALIDSAASELKIRNMRR